MRQKLLNSPVPAGFDYRPVYLEANSAKQLHRPLISKEESLQLKSSKTPITTAQPRLENKPKLKIKPSPSLKLPSTSKSHSSSTTKLPSPNTPSLSLKLPPKTKPPQSIKLHVPSTSKGHSSSTKLPSLNTRTPSLSPPPPPALNLSSTSDTQKLMKLVSSPEKLLSSAKSQSPCKSSSVIPLQTIPMTASPTVTVKQHVIKQKQLRVDQKFVCKECSQVYTHRSSLLKHHLKKHGKKHIEQGMISCKEEPCTFNCQRLVQLKEHLVKAHKKKIKETKEHFEMKEG